MSVLQSVFWDDVKKNTKKDSSEEKSHSKVETNDEFAVKALPPRYLLVHQKAW